MEEDNESDYSLWSLEELIEQICKRPMMFVDDADFLQLASYINGYLAGRGSKHFHAFRKFQSWLATKYYAEKIISSRAIPWQYCIRFGATVLGISELDTLQREYQSYRQEKSTDSLPELVVS